MNAISEHRWQHRSLLCHKFFVVLLRAPLTNIFVVKTLSVLLQFQKLAICLFYFMLRVKVLVADLSCHLYVIRWSRMSMGVTGALVELCFNNLSLDEIINSIALKKRLIDNWVLDYEQYMITCTVFV